jgi:26S proteasome regulatory subunit N2
LTNIIASVDARNQRNSLLHNAIVTAHSLMHTGTTVDKFLRVNLEWLKRASNWSKFTATAGIGAIHKGHVEDSMTLLETYLPKPGVSGSPYSEGGSLYALGLIHANTTDSEKTVAYLQTALGNAGADEVVQHGACLGLGLAAYGNGTEEQLEILKEVLFKDSAVAGEAAAYGLGLLMSGRDMRSDMVSETINCMLQYAHGTTHEKIIRGLSVGIAIAVVGQEDRAETLIEQMSRDKDPLVRYGAMYTTGMAYCGTNNNSAIRKLLHVAVSDVNDNVRRAAVTNLGFIMFRTPSQVPKLVSLLSESFNPHVRYGSALAIGIACAGTGSAEALALLEPMLEDSIDFVRQGALIGTAMVLMQETAANNAKVKPFRERLASIVGDKFQYLMTKMGAVIAAGVIDAGGRNQVISMQSRVGFRKNISVVGMAMFCQHWYWYPMPHFLSLSLSPTYIVGLNSDLKMPKSFKVKCNAKASRFAYPEKLKEKTDEKKEKVATVSLSTTAKAKTKQAKKEAKGGSTDTDMAVEKDDAPAETKPGEEKEGEKVKKEPEPSVHTLSNPSRVTIPQRALIEFDLNQRYVPIRQEVASGIVMLKDTSPDQNDDDLAEVCAPMIGEDQDEASAPKPFVWDSKAAFVVPAAN